MDKNDLKKIKALFLDMDGVLWTNNAPIGNLEQVFADIRKAGLIPLFGSNNGMRDPVELCEKLAQFGVQVKPEQFFTSGIATIYKLRKDFPDGLNLYVFGSESIKTLLSENGFRLVEENADAVLVSYTYDISYEKISRAMIEISEHHAKFYATNTDRTFITENGWRPGVGAMVSAIEACTDQKPIVIGKPNTVMIEMACKAYGLAPDEIIAVGDRYETDIRGGISFGARTALVLTGYETPETVPHFNPQPDLICTDLAELVSLFSSL